MTTYEIDYINPTTATQVRIHSDGTGNWFIDAADDQGGFTEVCWDSRYTTNDDGEREWELIPSVKVALELVPLFVAENVPHLADTKPRVILDSEEG